jgi:hypothetical protein
LRDTLSYKAHTYKVQMSQNRTESQNIPSTLSHAMRRAVEGGKDEGLNMKHSHFSRNTTTQSEK